MTPNEIPETPVTETAATQPSTETAVPQTTSLPKVRTLKTDADASIQSGETTVVSAIAAASRVQKMEQPEISGTYSTSNNKKVWLIAGALIVIVLGGIIFGYLHYQSVKEEERARQKIENIQAIIPNDGSRELSINNKTPRDIAFALGRERVEIAGKLGSIINIYFTAGEGEEKKYISTSDFLTQTDTTAPSLLLRALNPNFSAGVHIFDGNQMFLVFKVTSYENAFAGMLEWEESIEDRLLPLLRPAVDLSYPQGVIDQRLFQDSIIRNRDVRVLKNETGRTLLLYGFTDQKTLVIATGADTLNEVITRLNTRTTISQ